MPNYWTVQDYVPAIRGGGNQYLAAQNTAIQAKDLEARRQEAQRQLELQRAQEARMEREYLIRKSAEDRIVKAQADELKLKQGEGLGYQGAEIDPRMLEDDVFRTGWIGGRAAREKDAAAERARLAVVEARFREQSGYHPIIDPQTGEFFGAAWGDKIVPGSNPQKVPFGWRTEGDPLFGGQTRTPFRYDINSTNQPPPPPAATNSIPTSSGAKVPQFKWDKDTKKFVPVK
jgi:hypothetical protein